MVALESIEKLKQEFTDKFVVVDASVPELARFGSAVGQVKTVNMNGRALVEFDQYANTGWYDIELDFLKVVPKPEPKPAEAKPKVAEKSAEKPAAAKPVAAKPAAAGKPSTADILAAARAKKGSAPVAATTAKASPTEATAAQPAPAAGAKLSTAEILAAARGKAASAAAAPAAKKAAEPKPAVETPAEEPAAEVVAEEPVIKAEPVKKSAGRPKPTTTAEKIVYCRRVDTKG